jgi:hypothetical protein
VIEGEDVALLSLPAHSRLLSAGDDTSSSPLVTVPGYFGKTLGDPAFDWMMSTVPQVSALMLC